MKNLLAPLMILASILMLGSQASAVLVNFDTNPGGTAIASGTNINTVYSSLGVTFGCLPGSSVGSNLCTGNAFAVATGSAASNPNVISVSTAPIGALVDERFAFFTATFSVPVNTLSIDAMPVPLPEGLGPRSAAPFLQVFGAGGTFLGQTVYPGVGSCDPTVAGSCPYKTLTFSSATDIVTAVFSSFNVAGTPTTLGEFDNLNFSSVVSPVPEPATLLLFGLGIVAFSFRSKKR
jgi:hypothetical protein